MKYYHFEATKLEHRISEAQYELEDIVKIVFMITENEDYGEEIAIHARKVLKIVRKEGENRC